MRHRKHGKKFGRVRKVRKALLRSLTRALVEKEKITTTEAKAKELKPKIERLVTRAKKGTLAARRFAARELDRRAVRKLFSEIALSYTSRRGGYTRITKLGKRRSDSAKMAIIEFVRPEAGNTEHGA